MSRAMRFVVLPGVLLLGLGACTEKKADTGAAMDTTMSATPPAAPATQAPPAELRGRSDAFMAAWNQKDPNVLGAFFATDATVHALDSTYSGQADIVKRWIAPALPMLSNLAITNQVFSGTGDAMTETGNYSETWNMPKMAPAPHAGTYSITWNKAGADWTVKEMTVNETTPAAGTK